MHHLDANNILSESQFGFLDPIILVNPNYSSLLMTAKVINNRQQTDVGILDFTKAFDKVPCLRLL